MIKFSDIPPREQEILVRLPYRVGMWISMSDDGGGDDADEQEQQALEVLITAYVQDFCKSEFVQMIMEQTVAHKSEWRNWEQNIESVPEECEQVITFLSDKLDDKELRAFRDNLFEIGYSVAIAYREVDDQAARVRFGVYLKMWINRLFAVIKGEAAQSEDEALNISESEHKALAVLDRALTFERNVVTTHVDVTGISAS